MSFKITWVPIGYLKNKNISLIMWTLNTYINPILNVISVIILNNFASTKFSLYFLIFYTFN